MSKNGKNENFHTLCDAFAKIFLVIIWNNFIFKIKKNYAKAMDSCRDI
jgi:hypothetical protein